MTAIYSSSHSHSLFLAVQDEYDRKHNQKTMCTFIHLYSPHSNKVVGLNPGKFALSPCLMCLLPLEVQRHAGLTGDATLPLVVNLNGC